MHYLHRVLVKIDPIDEPLDDELIQQEIEDYARTRAENATEEYCGRVYDWRETETAGRWADSYPNNVMLSATDLDHFIYELEDAIQMQRIAVEFHKKCLDETSDSVTELIGACRNEGSHVGWHLLCLSELLYGEYTIESQFYNAEAYTAKINEDTIKTIKESPNEWALVMFDYHC